VTSPQPPLPVPDDDELDTAASAVVDGVASREEAALVVSSPDGRARVEMLRAVARAVGHPVPPQSPTAAATAMAEALGAFSANAPEPEPGDEATVITLAPPGSDGSARWLPRLGAVAAALVLLLGIGTLAANLLSGDDEGAQQSSRPEARFEEQTTLSSPKVERNAAAADATRGAGASEGLSLPPPPASPGPQAGGATTTAASAPPVVDGGDFGSQTDLQALVQRAAAALESPLDPSTTNPGATALPSDVQACVNAAPAAAGEPVGALRYRAVGSFQGTPAAVLAYDRAGDPPRLLLVLAREGCALLTSSRF